MIEGFRANRTLCTKFEVANSIITEINRGSHILLHSGYILSHVSTLTSDIDIGILSVCLSVRPSRSGIVWKWLNILSYCHYSLHIVLSVSNIFANFRRDHLLNTGGVKISRLSTSKSLYLANNTRQRHSYYGTLIGTRSVEWRYFQ